MGTQQRQKDSGCSKDFDNHETPFPFKTRLCLICSSYILADIDKRNDNQNDVDDAYMPGDVFLNGLSIICDKFCINKNYGTLSAWANDGVDFVKLICCKECCVIIKNIVTLYQLILTTEKSLNENVNKVKDIVLESSKESDNEYSINSCYQFRQDLLKQFLNNEQSCKPSTSKSSSQRKAVGSPGARGPAFTKGDRSRISPSSLVKLKPCFVKLDKIEDLLPLLDEPSNENLTGMDEEIFSNEDNEQSSSLCGVPLPPEFSLTAEVEDTQVDDDDDYIPTKRKRRKLGGKRGRPKKIRQNDEVDMLSIKRKRGRPKKNLQEVKIKRPRGRPKTRRTLHSVNLDECSADLTISNPQTTSDIECLAEEDSLNYKPDSGGIAQNKPLFSSIARPRGKKKMPNLPRQRRTLTATKQKCCVSYKPIFVIDAEKDEYSYYNVRLRKEGTTLYCKHPDCNFFVGNIGYFSDQTAIRTLKFHIRHIHRSKINSKSVDKDRGKPYYSCCYCDKHFESEEINLNHERKHENRTPFLSYCEVCGFSTSESIMTHHIHSHKSEEEKNAAVKEKHASIRRPGTMRDITLPSEFPCDQCDRVWSNQTNLRLHKITHTPIELRKQFQCDMCGSFFVSANSLRNHKNTIHFKSNTSYPLVCHICNKKYPSRLKYKFEHHMRVHSGECPFQCSQCGKAFGSKWNLTLHERRHTDMQLQCEFCTNVYKNKNYLRTHHLKHHPELISVRAKSETIKSKEPEYLPGFIGPKIAHPCEPCRKIYVFKSQLIAHMKHRHKLFLPTSKDYPEQNTFEMQEERDLKQEPVV